MPIVIRELLAGAGLARVQARGGNLAAEMKSRGIWESRQAPYKRAAAAPEGKRWERFVAEAGLVDRIARGALTATPGWRWNACWWPWPSRVPCACWCGPE